MFFSVAEKYMIPIIADEVYEYAVSIESKILLLLFKRINKTTIYYM